MLVNQYRSETMKVATMDALDAPTNASAIAYWVTTALATAAFAVPGVLNLVHAPHVAEDMAHLGYPPYMLTLLGVWKVLGAIAILAPRLPRIKEWAYAGMIFDLTGAAASRASSGDALPMMVVPLVIAAVVAASWALRPHERRLESPGGME
jgi:uncharacterized membrane protein YphA (DoxX/SURF4 family)